MHKIMTLTIKTVKSGFTLAETLITLTIIGVIATLTIPNLIQNHQTQKALTGLKAAHSIFSNAVKMAQIDHGPIETWDIGTFASKEGAILIGEMLYPHIKTVKLCKPLTNGCYATSYKNIRGTTFGWKLDGNEYYYNAQLANGMSMAIGTGGTGCKFGEGFYTEPLCGYFYVDINGPKPPNQFGVDAFEFFILKGGMVVPAGAPMLGSLGSPSGNKCSISGTNSADGTTCAAWLMYKGNMDYLKKEISWDE